ncbi:hypothetical protein IGI04_015493 [Brassica rapa subsp. trilocularis]|uniref:Uncharacterized protein n=1 Tax=Brassica rapa subsp. trilocularis TaxID=1813537 RepID=A0ABQ7MSR5_BRACM|nr:hypothetical protein IGI04_015493 [Brassica rapa subsp. trilocularis]
MEERKLSPTRPSSIQTKTKGQDEAQLTLRRKPNTRAQHRKENRRGSKLRHVIFHVDDRPAINETRVKTKNHFLPPEPEEATELHRRRRRTTEEPIFTEAQTESQNWWIYNSEKKQRRLQSILINRGSEREAVGQRRTESHRLPETETGEVDAVRTVASRRQSRTMIGGTDPPPETRAGR